MNPIAGFFAGALFGLVGSGILNLIWHLITGDHLSGLVVLIIMSSAAVGCTIYSRIDENEPEHWSQRPAPTTKGHAQQNQG